jgi:alpha-1,2-mannosyltransferase
VGRTLATSGTGAHVLTGPFAALRRSTRPWRMMAFTSLSVWCVAVAFVARTCIPRSLDLRVYRAAARLALHGGSPYATLYTSQHFAFTYPPFALFFLAPLSEVSLHAAVWMLAVLGAVALVLALALAAHRVTCWSWARCWVLASLLGGLSCLAIEPVRSTLLLGQVNLVLLALVVVDLLAVPKGSRGVLTGLAAAVKLTPLVFVLYLFVKGERRAALRAAATFVLTTAVLWLVRPADSKTFWLHQAFSPSRRGASRSVFNQSWWGLVGRLPTSDGDTRVVLWLALSALTITVGCLVVRRCLRSGRELDAILAMAVTGLLVSPVSWTHHWCWVALVPVALLATRPRPHAVTTAMWLLVAASVLAPYGWHVTGTSSVVPGFSLAGAGALLLVAMAVSRDRDAPVSHVESGAEAPAVATVAESAA